MNIDTDSPPLVEQNAQHTELDDKYSDINSLSNEDLDQAISFYQEALGQLPTTHPNRSSILEKFAQSLATRFERMGRIEDVNKAVLLRREALALYPAPHPDRCTLISNLASSLFMRFCMCGYPQDLNEVVILYKEALDILPAPHANRSELPGNLADAFDARFNSTGELADLDEAVGFHREALTLQHADHPSRLRSLNKFADTLNKRFGRTGQLADLDEIIMLRRDALMLLRPEHPDRPYSLKNLCESLDARFRLSSQREDLEEAILLRREALPLIPAYHPDRSMCLGSLAVSLFTQYQRAKQIHDLEEAIAMRRQSLDALNRGHPTTCLFTADLGNMLMAMYMHKQQTSYLVEAMDAFRIAVRCESASVSQRFRAARSWVHHTDSNHEFALEAHRAAIGLLPRPSVHGLDWHSFQQDMKPGSDSLARDAAACAIQSGQLENAVELIEDGRTIFWSQAMKLRTPLQELRLAAPQLTDRLESISQAPEQASQRYAPGFMPVASQEALLSMERASAHSRRLNERWLETVREVRSVPGFERFLQPKQFATLQGAALRGPVVILNASRFGCDALVLNSSVISRVLLPDITLADVQALVQSIRSMSPADNARRHQPSKTVQEELTRDSPANSDDTLRLTLEKLWKLIAEPVIRSLHLEKSESPPRLWWCPTGPFVLLPIHAAGIYDTEGGECVSDYVVSSYTVNLSSLLAPLPPSKDSFEMMVVVEPQTAEYPPLPGTLLELNKIEQHVPSDFLVKFGPSQAPASVENVLSRLPIASIAHLACHSRRSDKSPFESALVLDDCQLNISQIMAQRMSNASMAFLSASETAMGDDRLLDEAMHLAASFLFAGFHGVVATMWSIDDLVAAKIADNFYGYLFRENALTASGSFPDTAQAARALHFAAAKLRADNCPLRHWVAYVHMGL